MFGRFLPYLLNIAPVGMLYLATHFLYENKQRELKGAPVDEHRVHMMRLRLDTANQDLAREGETTLTGHFGVTTYLRFYHVRVLGLWLCIVTSLMLLTLPVVNYFSRNMVVLVTVLILGCTVTAVCYRHAERVHGHVVLVLCLLIAGMALGGMPQSAYHALWIALINNLPMIYIAFARSAEKTLKSDWPLRVMTVMWLLGHVASLTMMLDHFNVSVRWSWDFLAHGKEVAYTTLALSVLGGVAWLRTRLRGNEPMVAVVMEAMPVEPVAKASTPLPYVDGKTPLDLSFNAQKLH